MITFLAKLFIKKDATPEEERGVYGIVCGAVGICFNILLFLGKLFAGTISNSIAITADALNNLSDAGSSVISMVGFKLAGQKPDRQHPYGHGRIEYIAGLLISGVIVVMAYELLSNSVKKIIHSEGIEFSAVIVGILIFSILVKCYMAFYNFRIGKRIGSATIKAVAIDSLSDCIATSVVLISTLVGHFTDLQIDGYAGLIVGLFIAYAGIQAAKDTISPLLGQEPEEEYVHAIEEVVTNFDEHIVGIHDLMVHDYGPGRKIISLHAEVPAEGDMQEIHDVIDRLEAKLNEELGCMATIHMDPVAVNDPVVIELKEKVKGVLCTINDEIHMHDFRVVIGETHTNILFDAEVPFGYKMSDDELRDEVQKRIHEQIGEKYFSIIKIDKY